MSIKDYVTSQKLVEKFTSPFQLVSYASKLAKEVAAHGGEHQNLANDVLEMILEGRDKIGEEGYDEEEEDSEDSSV